MALTPEEEREYQFLLKEKKRLEAATQGSNELQKARTISTPSPRPEQDQGFSLTRMVGGALQDTWNGLWELQDWYSDKWASAYRAVGLDFLGSAVDAVTGTTQEGLASVLPENVNRQRNTAPTVELFEDSENPWENAGRTVVSFMVPYMGVGKAFGAFRSGLSLTSRVTRSLAASTAVNIGFMDATENNLANTLRDDFGFDNELLDALATEEDDSLLEGRLKMAVSNLPLDLAAEGLMEAGMAAIRSYKAVRANNAEAKSLLEATATDLTIKRTIKEETEASLKTTDSVAVGTSEGGAVIREENILEPAPAPKPGKTLPDGMVAVKPSQVKPKAIKTVDEFVDHVRTVMRAIPDDQAGRLEKIAKALVENPENALDELSIDPAKLDYSLFSNPQQIIAMQKSLGSLVDEVAARTGRTGRVVSNAETLKAGRILGTSAGTLADLVRRTKDLPSHLTGARILVGTHAHKLVQSVDAAIAEISAGGPGKAWYQFITDLSNHNVMLGALRGAGSEIGRALQSLQMAAPVREAAQSVTEQAAAALKQADSAAEVNAKEAAAGVKPTKIYQPNPDERKFLEALADGRVNDDLLKTIAAAENADEAAVLKRLGLTPAAVEKLRKAEAAYTELFKDLTTDAGKLRLLNQLKGAKGDLTKLNRILKSRDRTFLQHIDAVVAETKGNLFSLGTAGYNILGGIQVALDGIAHGLAAAGLGIRSVTFRNAEVGIAARREAYKALAHFHGPIMAFGDAMRNTWQILKKDGLDELSALTDTLGASKLAKELQAASNEAGAGITRGVVKEDMNGYTKALYISPEVINSIVSKAEEWPVPRFAQFGLEWFARATATALNTVGAGSRLSISAFINAPDQFVGTLSARAGAHVKAVDIALEEAAEAGLEGKALKDFVKARAVQLADGLDGISDDPFNDGAREVLDKAGEEYASRVTFSDPLETAATRNLAAAFEAVPILGSIVMPFTRTPLRVMERTIIDYSPLGVFKDRVRKAWVEGDASVRGEIAARYTLSMAALALTWQLTADRTIVGHDGGFKNSARLERSSYSIKIGNDFYEFNRLDPIGTLLGLTADIRQSMEAGSDARRSVAEAGLAGAMGDLSADVLEASFWAVFRNVLGKSWLESMDELMRVATADKADSAGDAFSTWLAGVGARMVPGSGVQRQFEKWDDGIVRQARGLSEGWLKASIGADELPAKLDPIFGRPMVVNNMERAIGLKGGTITTNKITQELARLAFNLPQPKWKQKGVELTSKQMNRLLELRGNQTIVEGSTLEDKITNMIEDPRWEKVPDPQKIELIKEAIQPHTKAALDALLREDDDFAYRALQHETRTAFKLEGRSREEADAETLRFAQELGLQPK